MSTALSQQVAAYNTANPSKTTNTMKDPRTGQPIAAGYGIGPDGSVVKEGPVQATTTAGGYAYGPKPTPTPAAAPLLLAAPTPQAAPVQPAPKPVVAAPKSTSVPAIPKTAPTVPTLATPKPPPAVPSPVSRTGSAADLLNANLAPASSTTTKQTVPAANLTPAQAVLQAATAAPREIQQQTNAASLIHTGPLGVDPNTGQASGIGGLNDNEDQPRFGRATRMLYGR